MSLRRSRALDVVRIEIEDPVEVIDGLLVEAVLHVDVGLREDLLDLVGVHLAADRSLPSTDLVLRRLVEVELEVRLARARRRPRIRPNDASDVARRPHQRHGAGATAERRAAGVARVRGHVEGAGEAERIRGPWRGEVVDLAGPRRYGVGGAEPLAEEGARVGILGHEREDLAVNLFGLVALAVLGEPAPAP